MLTPSDRDTLMRPENAKVNPGNHYLITGMHRSGTSLIAALVQALGWPLGGHLLAANAGNPWGYYEDLDAVRLHARLLRTRGHSPEGFSRPSPAEIAGIPGLIGELRAYIQARTRQSPEGWAIKDPRATLFLPAWAASAPGVKYLLVFRHPQGVAQSLQARWQTLRLPFDAPFSNGPANAWRLWVHYNSLILDFYRQNAAQCRLINVDDFQLNQKAAIEALGSFLGRRLPDDEVARVVQPHGLKSIAALDSNDSNRFSLPEPARELWQQLIRLARAQLTRD